MKRKLVTATLIAALLCSFAGCTNYWYQEGKTFEECKQDYVDCFEDMKRYSRDPEDLDKYEFKLMEDCMVLKGYRLVTERQLYVRVKREDPNLDVYWMVHGTAGFIKEQEFPQHERQ